MEMWVTTVEKELELAEQKANEAMNRLSKTELKLTKTASVLSAKDKEFTDYKGGEKIRKQTYYNWGFKDAENFAGPVIFEAWNFLLLFLEVSILC